MILETASYGTTVLCVCRMVAAVRLRLGVHACTHATCLLLLLYECIPAPAVLQLLMLLLFCGGGRGDGDVDVVLVLLCPIDKSPIDKIRPVVYFFCGLESRRSILVVIYTRREVGAPRCV